ncbi:MAG: DUF4405 domain-containing protein [Faecousia sp.]
MTLLLLAEMEIQITGYFLHEWLGAGMLTLLVAHNIDNISWWRNIGRGRCTLFRKIQTTLDLLIFVDMLALMISGVILSKYVFSALPSIGSITFARLLHLVSSYWGFALMTFHLGFHGNLFIRMAERLRGITREHEVICHILHLFAGIFLLYGFISFFRRGLWRYMLLISHYAFFDYKEPAIYFFLDYLAITATFIWSGYQVSKYALTKCSFREI